MKRTILSLLLAAALMLGVCACGTTTGTSGTADNSSKTGASSTASSDSASVSSEETSKTNGNVSLRIAIDMHDADVSDADFTKFKPTLKKAAEELGYDIEWIPVREGEAMKEQISVMLAGNLPDVFWGLLSDTQIVDNAGLFVPLEDKIEKYAPNVYSLYESSVDNWREFLTYPDGHIYSMMGNVLASPNNFIDGTMWINQTWLDKLGMEAPATMAELEKVLAGFRDNDMDGDGDASNEIPLDWAQSYWSAKYYEMARSFGLPIGDTKMYDIVDGKVVSAVDTDAFRGFLEKYHQMTADGLVNMEGTTQTSEQYIANISSGKVGAFWGWAPYTFITDADLQSQYVPLAPISADGTKYRVQPNRVNANRNGYVITTACQNVEAAMNLWNYLAKDEETSFSAAFGPEGLIWEFVDGVPTTRNYTAEEATEMGFGDIASNAGTSTFAATIGLPNCGPLMINARKNAAGTTGSIREESVKPYEPYFTEQSMSKAIVPSEVSEEFAFTTDGLEDYINTFACDAILNGVTDASWNEYLSGLPQRGYDYYLTYYQNYLDGTFE